MYWGVLFLISMKLITYQKKKKKTFISCLWTNFQLNSKYMKDLKTTILFTGIPSLSKFKPGKILVIDLFHLRVVWDMTLSHSLVQW